MQTNTLQAKGYEPRLGFSTVLTHFLANRLGVVTWWNSRPLLTLISNNSNPIVDAVALTLIGLPPFLLFSSWLTLGAGKVDAGFLWRLFLAGSWFLLAPVLIARWDERRSRAYQSLSFSQDLTLAVRTLDSLRGYVSFVISVCTCAGFFLSRPTFEKLLGSSATSGPWLAIGIVLVAGLGYTFGEGIWGVIATLIFIRVATRIISEKSANISDGPMNSILEDLSSFGFRTALLFSCGSVFLPGSYFISRELPFVAQSIGYVIATLLVGGSLATMLLPAIWVRHAAEKRQETSLREIQTELDVLVTAMRSPATSSEETRFLSAKFASMEAVRRAMHESKTAPAVNLLIGKLAALLVLPTLGNLVEFVGK